jgi:hypothetical protein
LYTRWKNIGVMYKSKKHRLKTLWLECAYTKLLREFELKEAREMKRSDYKQAQKWKAPNRKEQLKFIRDR